MGKSKLTNLSDGKISKSQLRVVDCKQCGGTGMIGNSKCPVCSGVGSMTRTKQKRIENGK